MLLDDQQISSAQGNADAFNRYSPQFFVQIFQTITNFFRRLILRMCLNISIPVSTEDVNSVLSTLSTDKAAGPDEISARLLEECANEIALSRTVLFNKSLSLGKAPQEWKEAKVTPIHEGSCC